MTRQDIFDTYPGGSQDLVFLEPEYFDKAIIGVAQRMDNIFAVCYSEPTIIRLLQEHEGMNQDEAVEWFNFNTFGAFLGLENSPIFVDDEILFKLHAD